VAGSFFRGSARPLISAIIADLAPPERRKEAFGLQYWSINVGVAVGPLVAAYLFDRDVAWLFRGDGICSLASAALIAAGVRMPKRSRAGTALEREDSRGALKAFLARPILPAYCGLAALSAFTYSQTDFSLSLTLSDALGDSGPSFFGAMMSLNAVTVIVLSIPIARMMRRRRPLWCMAVAGGAFVLGFGMLAFPWGRAWIAASTFAWTNAEIVQSVNMGVFVSRHSPANWRGSFQSFTSVFSQAGHSLGPLVAGPAIAAAGSGGLWLGAAAICGLWSAGAFALDRRDSATPSETA
jgi:predicted MFS family arabinose efflux permease